MNLSELQPDALPSLSDEAYRELLAETVELTREDRRQNQLLFYRPASARAQQVHDCKSRVVGVGGGNGSGKTDTMLVDVVMSATGIFPLSQRHLVGQKFRGPINCRVVVESLTTTLEPIILPKLMWWRWSGADAPGGEKGHWGWVPKDCLLDGDWQRSWSSKLRLLRLLCRDPEHPERILGDSTIQFMSKDMDATDFASGDFHLIGHDEPPNLAQWRENEARTMRVGGRILLAMTWPDDPSINVDWLYNEVYEVGRSGSDPEVAWFELWTTDNQNLDQASVAAQAGKWSQEIASVRIYGRPIRFSNRIHPEFTDNTKTWCFKCDKSVVPVPGEYKAEPVCPNCASERLAEFNHVEEFEASPSWPTVFLLDPHPRKPHMFLWVQITPSDDWRVVAEGKCEGDCADVRKAVDEVEQSLGLFIGRRLIDPNMGASPSGQKREVNWRDEFAAAGLNCDLADDVDVGRARVNAMLRPDPDTLRPRAIFHPRCRDAIYQMNRYSWGEYARSLERDLKQKPKDLYDDHPTLLKYLANSEPVFRFLKNGPEILRRPGQRVGSY